MLGAGDDVGGAHQLARPVLADDQSRHAGALVKDAADGVIHRRLGVEFPGRRILQPPPKSTEEPRDALPGLPLAGWVEVGAEPLALQDMGMAEKAKVVDLDLRDGVGRRRDPEDELLAVAEL